MICPQCQSENREGVKFCEDCGARMDVECPNCKAKVPPGKKFCGDCGHDLRKLKEAPPIDYQQPRSYTPKFLADKILTSRSAIEGERKLVTVLFADVARFTAMSEKLDPEDVHEIMDGCFRILMDEIHRFEGTVNEFRGDGLMALFGAPIAHEDHAQRACHAALAIQQALIPYEERLQRQHGVDFKMRIGLNSGPVVVGAIGDDLRMDYTAQGDTANLAARMESNAQPGSILVSNHIYRQAKEFFQFEPVGELRVKGKEEPVEAYRLIKPTEVQTRIAASAAKGLTRFVGRQREIATLSEAFRKAQSGVGQVVGVVGEAGVGKSRLLLEFRNSLPKSAYIYLEGRCLHYGNSMPYLPILDAFRTYLGIKEGEKESVIRQKMMERIVGSDETLTRCLSPIQELFSIKVDDEEFTKLEPKQKREKTFEAIRDILIRGSQSRPIVWAIEDLHWIDRTTEEFLDYMIGWLPNTRILLILLYRPEYTHQWGSKSYYSKVGVGQLSSNTSAELVQAILEGEAVVPELRELILSRAAGNPLFMEELTHSLLENGSVQKKEDQYVLVRNASEIQVPETVQGIIAARMDRLEESLKRIMQVAAVIGREFAFRILQAIIEMKEDLKSKLLKLQGLEYIYEKSLFPELEYIFRHALTQEVAYSSLLRKRRKEIHERIGQAIEDLYPERLEEFYEMLAYHYSKTENYTKACHYLKISGEKAIKNDSPREAFRLFNDAIGTFNHLPETAENKRKYIDLVISMSIVMRQLGYPEDSATILQKGEALAKALDDVEAAVFLRSAVGICHALRGNSMQSHRLIDESFVEAESIQNIDSLVSSAYDKCSSYLSLGQFKKIIGLAQKAMTLLENTHRESESFGKPANPYCRFLALCGYAVSCMGNFLEGERLLDKGLCLMHETGSMYGIGLVELFYGRLFVNKGDGSPAAEHNRKAAECFEKSQAVVFLGTAWCGVGNGYYFLGQYDTALRHMQKGLEIQTEIGVSSWLSEHYRSLSMVYSDTGDLKKARSFSERALELSQQNNETKWEACSRILLGRIVGKMDRPQVSSAEREILKGIKILDELNFKPFFSIGYLYLGELNADTDQNESALQYLKKAESMFQEMGMDYWLGKAQEALARL